MTSTASPAIVSADVGEAGTVADLVAEAFQQLAATAWLVPEPERRRGVLRDDFLILVEYALAYGTVEVTTDRAAAAVWFPRTAPIPEPPEYDRRLVEACGDAVDRFRVLGRLFDEHHPERPHHHLAFLAVRPPHQGRGLGTALLRHHHALLDRIGLPAYLEASSEGSRELYARHGYRVREPFHLPDGTPFWPMWREPVREP